MDSSTSHLVLASDGSIDLQLHTVNSDGTWLPEQLIDYLLADHFALAAITDHDRIDTAIPLQALATAKRFPLLVAAEISAAWRGKATDVLCYGFDPANANDLGDLTDYIARRRRENTREVYANLVLKGDLPPESEERDDLEVILQAPSARQPRDLLALVRKYQPDHPSPKHLVKQAGFVPVTVDIRAVVAQTHRSGGVCLLAHPGRHDEITFDEALLDQLRAEVAVDGLEVYYPTHSTARTARYLEYVRRHRLLMSAGSDSHSTARMPIKYPAGLCSALLGRLGIEIRP